MSQKHFSSTSKQTNLEKTISSTSCLSLYTGRGLLLRIKTYEHNITQEDIGFRRRVSIPLLIQVHTAHQDFAQNRNNKHRWLSDWVKADDDDDGDIGETNDNDKDSNDDDDDDH